MNTEAKLPVPKKRQRKAKVGSTYQGIRILDMSAGSQFTREEVIRAVEAAIAKCPEAFAVRKT